MLVTVIDLISCGAISGNRIEYSTVLTNRFEQLFSVVQKDSDTCHPSEPFFHLRTSGFWFHKPQRGKERSYVELDTSGGGSKRILDNVEYAFLDPDSYTVMCDAEARKEVLESLLALFFTSDETGRLAMVLASDELRNNTNEASTDGS